MHVTLPFASCPDTAGSQACSNTEMTDVWFDAVDHVEMDKEWFGAGEDGQWADASADDAAPLPDPGMASAARAERLIPFTEDCWRCVKELIIRLGEIKESELVFVGLARIFPALPADLIALAHGVYVALTEKRNVDIAVLNALGLTSTYLLEHGNAVSRVAHYLRETLLGYAGQSDAMPYFAPEENSPSNYVFTGLALLAVVAKRWMTDGPAPQRRLLRLPAFLGNLILRAGCYWDHLGRIAQRAPSTCQYAYDNEFGRHRYYCEQELKAPIAASSWLCTRVDTGSGQAAPTRHCTFSGSPARAQLTSFRSHADSPVEPSGAASADAEINTAIQPLVAAAAGTALAAPPHPGWNSRMVRGAALVFAGTSLLAAGRLMRDAFLSRRRDDTTSAAYADHQIAAATTSSISEIHFAVPGKNDAGSIGAPVTAAPLPFRNRLIGYLHSIHPFHSRAISDKEMAQKILHLLKESDAHQAALAHIALYATGLFGERHDEYLDPVTQKLLVGDMLSKLLFGQRSLETFLLDQFADNRRISIEDFYKKVTGWTLHNADEELKAYFHEEFLFPLMPILNLDFHDPEIGGENRKILVGSTSWFFMYMGTQFMWATAPEKKKYDVEEMTLFGGYVFNMLMTGALIEGSIQVLAPGIKIAGLFLRPEWTVENLPDLSEVQAIVCKSILRRIKQDSQVIRQLDAAKNEVEKTAKTPWSSRRLIALELLQNHCGTTTAKLFEENSESGRSVATKIISTTRSSAEILMAAPKNLYCFNKRRQFIKIPTANYKYRIAIANFVGALRMATNASLSQLFSINDVYREEFSYDDYDFIYQAALEEVDIVINRARDIREKMAFGPLVEKWQPKFDYLIFNATLGQEVRTYIANVSGNEYSMQRVDVSNILYELMPYFHASPDDVVGQVNAVISTNPMNARKNQSEPISVFIERLAWKKYITAENILYEAGYDTPFREKLVEVLKDVFIPFYSCITSLQKGDADNAVVSCVLDGTLILGPLIKGTGKIIRRFVKVKRNKIYTQLIVSVNFVASRNLIRRQTITFQDFIPRFNLYTDRDTLIAGKSFLYLIMDAIDPGFAFVVTSKRMISDFGRLFIRGNALAAFGHVSKNWKNLVEASVRVKAITDSRKVLVGVSRMTNWGGDFDEEFNRTVSYGNASYHADSSFLALVFVHDGYYNIFRLDKTEIYFPASETGEVSKSGTRIYTMLSINAPNGVFVKYVCKDDLSADCVLSPWFPAEASAHTYRPVRAVSAHGVLHWIFGAETRYTRLTIYPDHQCEMYQDGYDADKLYEIVEINDVHYIFSQQEVYLRPLRGGDNALIVPRRAQNHTASMGRWNSGELTIFLAANVNSSQSASIFLDEKYQLKEGSCDTSQVISLNPEKELTAAVGDKCFSLRPAAVRNRFVISAGTLPHSAVKLGWSEKKSGLVPVKPYIGESSVRVGIDLEDFVGRQRAYCQGTAIGKLPMELMSGAVWDAGKVWLKILGSYYRLGTWREDLCPLHCHNNSAVAAWLRYDLFTESFDLVQEGSDWAKAILDVRESGFEKLARKVIPRGRWSAIPGWLRQADSSTLMLRLYQTSFLQSLSGANRRELLSLPVAQARSWLLHADAAPFMREYPALSLGLSQFRQMTSPVDGVTPNKLSLLHHLLLRNDLIGNYSAQGKLIPGISDDHEAIWLRPEPQPIALKRYLLNFYGEHVTIHDGEMIWIPTLDCAPAVTVTQFMQDIYFRPEPRTTLYRNKISLVHPKWGRVELHRDIGKSEIEYVWLSPRGSWAGLVDQENYLTLFSLENVLVAGEDNIHRKIAPASRHQMPIQIRKSDLSLCIVTEEGEFYYPERVGWRSLSDEHILWSAPIGFQPTFISSDQRFLGFENLGRSGALIYDQHQKKAVFLGRPPSEQSWNAVSAVAFSPMNAMVVLAFNDGHVYMYSFDNPTAGASLDPISHVELKKLFYVDMQTMSSFKQTIVMRFFGVFRYLTVIYDAGFIGEQKKFVKKNFVYDIYGFLPEDTNLEGLESGKTSTVASTRATAASSGDEWEDGR